VIRLLKNTHLLRYAHPSSLQRTRMYASFLRISRALHLDVFEQPAKNYFLNSLLEQPVRMGPFGQFACRVLRLQLLVCLFKWFGVMCAFITHNPLQEKCFCC